MANIEQQVSENEPGLKVALHASWIVWTQEMREEGILRMTPLYKFSTAAGLWLVIDKLGNIPSSRITIMREGITPTFENKNHKNGGYFSIALDPHIDQLDIFVECLLGLVGEKLSCDTYDSENVTGLTLVSDRKFHTIRYWVTDYNNMFNRRVFSDQTKKAMDNYQNSKIRFYQTQFSKLVELN